MFILLALLLGVGTSDLLVLIRVICSKANAEVVHQNGTPSVPSTFL